MAMVAVISGVLISAVVVKAQSPRTFRIPPTTMQDHLYTGGSELQAAAEPLQLIIDADPGVDDALALLWLFSQPTDQIKVLGAVAVAGNSSVENTASNLITILDLVGHADIPVIVGAKKPLKVKLSLATWLIHGPDGLWFAGQTQDLSDLPKKPDVFYCAQALENPDATILALGPLTNLALAVKKCGARMQNFAEIIVLGGAKFGGNQTPVTEFNFWQDPEAAKIVSEAGLNLTIVPLDAFGQFALNQRMVDFLLDNGNDSVVALAPAIAQYLQLQLDNGGIAVIPDATAAIYALDHRFGNPLRALVRVLTKQEAVEIARGQSIVGLFLNERITMLADDALLSSWAVAAFDPDSGFDLNVAITELLEIDEAGDFGVDNAHFVIDVDENAMIRRFLTDLTQASTSVGATSVATEIGTDEELTGNGATGKLQEDGQIFLPSILFR